METGNETTTNSEELEIADETLRPRKFAFVNAKCYLKQNIDNKGNVYDHLVSVIRKVLKSNDPDSLKNLEKLSSSLKRYECSADRGLIVDVPPPSEKLKLAILQKPLFVVSQEFSNDEQQNNAKAQEKSIKVLPDLQKLFFILEQAGLGWSTFSSHHSLGLPQEEILHLILSIKQFLQVKEVNSLRFWGKIYGIRRNYYILEVEEKDENAQVLNPKQTPNLLSEELSAKPADEPVDNMDVQIESLDLGLNPKPEWKYPPDIPSEDLGKGTNRKAYYVCNTLGEMWTRLPNVTPLQIQISRKIRYILTGDLEAEISSFPTFPGTEKDYLRAQIARITGSCIISPINYYQFDENEEEALEEDAVRETFIENPEFEPMTIYDLADPGLNNWVHHTAYILPQGRTVWWDPASALKAGNDGNNSEEEEETEDLDEPDRPEPETGPPLLTPLSEDAEISGIPPWSCRITSTLVPHYAYCVLASNSWPGAYAIAQGRLFENIYIGWAQKYLGDNFNSQPIPEIFEEFPSGPETAEVEDPSPEEEAAWRAAQAEAALALQRSENEDQEEDEEEEEEDNDGGDDDDEDD